MNKIRTNNPEATKGAVLKAAEELFINKGFHGTSMSMIAKEAGVTQSLIHHHFGSKQDLWNVLKESKVGAYFSNMVGNLREEGASPMELLSKMVTSNFSYLREHPDMVKLILWDLLEEQEASPFEVPEVNIFDEVLKRFQTAQQNGVVRDDVEPVNMFVALSVLVQGWFWTKLDKAHHLSDDMDNRYLEDVIKIFSKGISS